MVLIGVVGLLEVVEGDAEGFAAAEVFDEGVVCLCGLGFVMLC
jgi:hypothetical protein